MKTFVGGEGCVKTMLALLFILLKVRKIWAQIHNKKKKDCYKAASNRSSGVEKTDIIPSPWLNSQAEMCIAYWGSDTVPLFYRKSLCCTACMSAWPCHRARATQSAGEQCKRPRQLWSRSGTCLQRGAFQFGISISIKDVGTPTLTGCSLPHHTTDGYCSKDPS